MKKAEIDKVQGYMRRKFQLPTINVRARLNKADSAEVFIGDEFIGVLYRDDEEGDLSWNFSMAILAMDVED